MRSKSNASVVETTPCPKRFLCAVSFLAVILLTLGACGGDEDGDEAGASEAGAVTITTKIDFTDKPYRGTFSVEEGSEALGCASGTFVDIEVDIGLNKKMTCEEGERQGTFTIFFEEGQPGAGWRVEKATGDFSGLQGFGDFSLDLSKDEKSGVETFTGNINY
jgi:hypothetical protein